MSGVFTDPDERGTYLPVPETAFCDGTVFLLPEDALLPEFCEAPASETVVRGERLLKTNPGLFFLFLTAFFFTGFRVCVAVFFLVLTVVYSEEVLVTVFVPPVFFLGGVKRRVAITLRVPPE